MLQLVSGNKPGGSNAHQVQIPCIVFFIVTPIFVGIRFWSRTRIKGGLGRDDWTILASFLFSILVSALVMASCYYGFGQHVVNLAPYNRKKALKLYYVAQAFYKLTMNLTKASILLLYLRIFVQRPFRIICYIMLSIILSYMVATFCASVFQCTPIPRSWDKSIPGTCISIPQNWYANAGFSIATDFIILVMPMPLLWRSRIPINQKAALMAVFGLGAFVVVTSILRMQTLNLSSTSPDMTYEIASSLWTIIEENVGIICACLPMCKPILTFLMPSTFPATSKQAPYASDGSKFVYAGSGKNDWTPGRGDAADISVQLATVTARGHNASDESILPHDVKNGKAVMVRKSTDYNVEYRQSTQ